MKQLGHVGYFDAASATEPLLHLWSLGIVAVVLTSPAHDRVRALAKRAGAEIVEPATLLCPESKCAVFDRDGHFLHDTRSHVRASWAQKHFTRLDAFVVP